MKIKHETAPQRCEICHQSDCFTPETGVCRRCQPVSQSIQTDRSPALTSQAEANLEWQFLTLVEARLEERKQEQLQVQKWRKLLSGLSIGIQGAFLLVVVMCSISYLLSHSKGLDLQTGLLMIGLLCVPLAFIYFSSKKSNSDPK
ncbi:MAG TPA: hypothetical protein PLB18_18745 [Acidobacteriota bacterium]|nr:hypothetical protein [Acidobacteriota bacterium]